jgi:hypothetical protein
VEFSEVTVAMIFIAPAVKYLQLRTSLSVRTAAVITILLLGTQFPVASQSIGNANSSGAEKGFPGDSQAHDSMAEEVRAKRAIQYAEKQYKQHLNRARELSDLGKELDASFQRKKSLDDDDCKKLERLEKLTKRIRDEAGGSDDEAKIDNLPANLAGAVNRVAEISESLREKIQKTPRQVVSTTVIADANVLLELIHMVRQFTRQG